MTTYRMTVSLPRDLVERFREAVHADGRTISGAVRVLAERYLEEEVDRRGRAICRTAPRPPGGVDSGRRGE